MSDNNELSAGKKCLVVFSDHAIKPYIPRIWAYFLDFLAFKGDADEFRTNPLLAMSQERKTPIVIRTAHADSIAFVVKNNGWRDDHIELVRVDQEATRGLPDAEAILFEFGVGSDFAKHHLRRTAQNRNENALVCAPCASDDFSRIDFVVHRQVTADGLGRVKRV